MSVFVVALDPLPTPFYTRYVLFDYVDMEEK